MYAQYNPMSFVNCNNDNKNLSTILNNNTPDKGNQQIQWNSFKNSQLFPSIPNDTTKQLISNHSDNEDNDEYSNYGNDDNDDNDDDYDEENYCQDDDCNKEEQGLQNKESQFYYDQFQNKQMIYC